MMAAAKRIAAIVSLLVMREGRPLEPPISDSRDLWLSPSPRTQTVRTGDEPCGFAEILGGERIQVNATFMSDFHVEGNACSTCVRGAARFYPINSGEGQRTP